MEIKKPNYTQEAHQMPLIIRKAARNKMEQNQLTHELVHNLNILLQVETQFTNKVFYSDVDYNSLYEAYRKTWERKTKSMKLKFTMPNPGYFERNYMPVEI